jgi:hypothetical protein
MSDPTTGEPIQTDPGRPPTEPDGTPPENPSGGITATGAALVG